MSPNSSTLTESSTMPSTDLDRVEESNITILPPKQMPSTSAIAVLREAAQAMEVAHHYASAVCNTQVCPQRFRGKPDDGAAAILYGLEVGLSPAQSLQRVVVIHGMPSLEARTMVGLLKARGYKISTLEQSDEQVTVEGFSPDGDRAVSQWTIERAIKAGYVPEVNPSTGKLRTNANGKLIGNEKYLTDPQAMLKAKAQAEVCRDLAPDVLMGIQYATEDLVSERWDGTISVDRPAAAAPVTVEEILGAEPEPTPSRTAPEPAPEPVQSRVATETISAEEPAEAPDDAPVAAQDDEGPAPDGQPADTLSGPPDADEPDDNAPVKVRQLFALLREGDVTDREDRLVIFRALAERPDITSTKDLGTRDLNRIVAKLKGWSDQKTIQADCAEILWQAAAVEANAAEAAAAAATTEENQETI